jgi:hypothetical protein
MFKSSLLIAICVMSLSTVLFAGPPIADINDIYISEIIPDGEGAEPDNEYIELRGPASNLIPTGVYYVGIEGDAGQQGTINEVIDLSGLTFGTNGGILLISNPSLWDDGDIPIAAGTTVNNSLFSGAENDTATYCLIQWDGTTATDPTAVTDLDTDDDGDLDDGTEGGGALNYAGTWTFIDGVCSVDDGNAADQCYGPFIAFSQEPGFANASGVIVDTSAITDETQLFGRRSASTGDTAADWYTATLPIPVDANDLANYVGVTFPAVSGADGTIPANLIGELMFGTLGGPINIPVELSAFGVE